jgi:rRNA pseudouridine-1189 N-methylase Emg1 (Nep1/Mra1 family)
VFDTYDISNLPSLDELKNKNKEDNTNRKFQDLIVTADLESLVNKDGTNNVYMAAWYNGKIFKVYDITYYNMDSNKMLSDFWFDLIKKNEGQFVYFHTGYDSILSLSALVNLPYFPFLGYLCR